GHDHSASIRNSFDFAARLVGGGRTVHPVSRVFRSAFHGSTSYRTITGAGPIAGSTVRAPRGCRRSAPSAELPRNRSLFPNRKALPRPFSATRCDVILR